MVRHAQGGICKQTWNGDIAQDFDTVMAAIGSNNERWGIFDVRCCMWGVYGGLLATDLRNNPSQVTLELSRPSEGAAPSV